MKPEPRLFTTQQSTWRAPTPGGLLSRLVKRVFAIRIRRLLIFRWLVNMLRADDHKQLHRDIVQTALELEFPAEEALRQLETMINWGRYEVVLAYDDDIEILCFEP